MKQTAPRELALDGVRVLLVDDYPLLRHALRRPPTALIGWALDIET
jgi:hypothetical protein